VVYTSIGNNAIGVASMKIRLIVPNCNRNTSPIVAYGPTIADIAGGFTATRGIGGWKDDQGKLIVEPVTVFDCFCECRAGNDYTIAADFRHLAQNIAIELKQDCVYLEIDGQVTFVKA
jgi:hypothetical protein